MRVGRTAAVEEVLRAAAAAAGGAAEAVGGRGGGGWRGGLREDLERELAGSGAVPWELLDEACVGLRGGGGTRSVPPRITPGGAA